MDLFLHDEALLPELSIDNIEKLGQMLQKEGGCMFVDAKFNTIIRRFHRLRYAK